MRRTLQPVHLHRDPALKSLPFDDIRLILRAADSLIAVGGRSLLTRVLRGSQARDVLAHGLETNPAFGAYKHLSDEEVLIRIDWTIFHHYLRVEYAGRLPVLVYTADGWAIECEQYADEIVAGFDSLLAQAQRPYDMLYLKDRHRGIIFRVLEKIRDTRDCKYLPLLEDWAKIDYQKVRAEIRSVMRSLVDDRAFIR
ncbi:hypothetical protein CR105_17805 [Massilia eurypsychrophila]|uniref:RQC domain-containing protein n=1 Tax=Massilia eurypsychrophila TaxID=1485217 RepID=A0A2G8TC35_9BURK|nr:RQC-minor-1 family DNA-binding protein [Massilia eurypsychrophila]PIL43616.1 hypothetical protein CR105_17805 [Massilia eurypsychrophila]